MKKMWHIFDREKNYGALNRGTLIRFLMKNTLKCKKNKTFFLAIFNTYLSLKYK